MAYSGLIVARALLKIAKEEVPNLEAIESDFEQEGIVKRFPDASIYLTTRDAGDRFHRMVFKGRPLSSQAVYRSLAPFGPARYVLLYPRRYWDSLVRPTGGSFACGTNVGPPTANEFKLESLALTVRFKRRPNTEVREQFTRMIMDWLSSVRDHGIFEEGPMIRAQPYVEFQGLRARLRVDARASRQHTLNWFVLNALHFGIERWPITLIFIDAEEILDANCAEQGEVKRAP